MRRGLKTESWRTQLLLGGRGRSEEEENHKMAFVERLKARDCTRCWGKTITLVCPYEKSAEGASDQKDTSMCYWGEPRSQWK